MLSSCWPYPRAEPDASILTDHRFCYMLFHFCALSHEGSRSIYPGPSLFFAYKKGCVFSPSCSNVGVYLPIFLHQFLHRLLPFCAPKEWTGREFSLSRYTNFSYFRDCYYCSEVWLSWLSCCWIYFRLPVFSSAILFLHPSAATFLTPTPSSPSPITLIAVDLTSPGSHKYLTTL